MTKIYCSVAESGIEYRYEETDTPIFVKKITWLAHQKPKMIEYLGVEKNIQVQEDLKSFLSGESTSHFFHRALVRHGHGIHCGYYPLPLIFASKEAREAAAFGRGIRPPSENWVMAKRKEVMDYYGLNEKKPMLKRLFEFFGSKNSLVTV